MEDRLTNFLRCCSIPSLINNLLQRPLCSIIFMTLNFCSITPFGKSASYPPCSVLITSCRRPAATVCPTPLLPHGRLVAPSRRQRISSFPRPTCSHAHRCSRLTRQHGGEQSGLVTLTIDLENDVRVTCDVSYLGPMYATDVRQTLEKSIA